MSEAVRGLTTKGEGLWIRKVGGLNFEGEEREEGGAEF